MADQFKDAVRKTVLRHGLITNEDTKLLLAVSGGADSVSMLLVIRELYPLLSLTVCHLNHCLRGKEADMDEAFVRDLCETLVVPFIAKRTDAAAYAASVGKSVETAARELRYRFFADVCRERGIRKIATAHTASDNAETLVFNLIRGASLQGLCGIPPARRVDDSIDVIRPLIGVTRSDVEAYLAERGQAYRTDESNFSDDYSRNYIRHHLIPAMRSLNPSFEQTASRTSDTLRVTDAYLDRCVAECMTDRIDTLLTMDKAIRTRVIMALIASGTVGCSPEHTHIEAIEDALHAAAAFPARRYEVCLPGAYSAILQNGTLSFAKTVRKSKEERVSYRVPLCRGFNDLSKYGYAVMMLDADDTVTKPDADIRDAELIGSCVLNLDAVSGMLSARNRCEGDTVRCAGQTKKLKRLFCGMKLTPETRSNLPLIEDEDGIVFVPPSVVCDKQKKAVCVPGKAVRILIYSYKQITT